MAFQCSVSKSFFLLVGASALMCSCCLLYLLTATTTAPPDSQSHFLAGRTGRDGGALQDHMVMSVSQNGYGELEEGAKPFSGADREATPSMHGFMAVAVELADAALSIASPDERLDADAGAGSHYAHMHSPSENKNRLQQSQRAPLSTRYGSEDIREERGGARTSDQGSVYKHKQQVDNASLEEQQEIGDELKGNGNGNGVDDLAIEETGRKGEGGGGGGGGGGEGTGGNSIPAVATVGPVINEGELRGEVVAPGASAAVLDKGFVLMQYNFQQLMGSILDYSQLIALASMFGLRSLEPIITPRSSIGIPDPNTSISSSVPFREIFDFTAANRLLSECLGTTTPPLIPLEEFSTHTFSNAVGMRFPPIKTHTKILDCFERNRSMGYSRDINAYFGKDLVNVTSIVCTNIIRRRKVVLKTMMEYALNQAKGDPLPLLIFVNWRGVFRAFPQYYFVDRTFPYNSRLLLAEKCHLDILPHSERVLEATRDFSNSLGAVGRGSAGAGGGNTHTLHSGKAQPFLVIHMRLERLLWNDKRGFKRYTEKCLEQFWVKLKDVWTSKELTAKHTYYFRDYGRYGTDTCEDKCVSYGLDEQVSSMNITVAEYNPEAFDVPEWLSDNTAFAAAVELEFLSGADYLMVVGEGAFHNATIARFSARHPTDWQDRLFQVCTEYHDWKRG